MILGLMILFWASKGQNALLNHITSNTHMSKKQNIRYWRLVIARARTKYIPGDVRRCDIIRHAITRWLRALKADYNPAH